MPNPQTSHASLRAIDWILPSVELLDPRPSARIGSGVDHASNSRRIQEKLTSFGIPAEVVAVNQGPTVTQYEIRPAQNVKIGRIAAMRDDLAMALRARSIRIEAPVPGKDVVGIEIPNGISEVVGFRSVVEETHLLDATGPLSFALGRDVPGRAYAVDLARMPHLLVTGATGSGKTSCLNALVTSLLMRLRPDEVRLLLVDLDRMDFLPYNSLPHLLQRVILEPTAVRTTLAWLGQEVEDRHRILAAHRVRTIAAFNALTEADVEASDHGRMAYIVVIINELEHVVQSNGPAIDYVLRNSRGSGVHLVCGLTADSPLPESIAIAQNFTTRIRLSMTDASARRLGYGAEDLIGRGDMLYQPVDLPRPVRMQGVFVGDREVGEVTKHWHAQTGGRTFYDEDILAYGDPEDATGGGDGGQFGWLRKYGVDEMTIQAAELVTGLQRASTSMLQTKLKLGFARASRVMDEMERYGIIGPQDPRNPASPRMIYGPDNWLRTIDEGDGEDIV